MESLRRKTGMLRASGLRLGIGDDCAIFRPSAREDLLLTTDLLIENVHFEHHTHTGRDVGYKALARGLSDIAAMGGAPRFCLVSLAAGAGASERWIRAFFAGLLELAKQTRTALAGGDMARAKQTTCDIVVCGAVPRGRALRRDGARPGDSIYVSGLLGGSALGLETRRGLAWRRHKRPEPRLRLGIFLRERVRASASMDVSDGLSLDLRRLCLASGVSAHIEAAPRFPGASLEQALHGGEDYELLFTAPPRASVPSQFRGLALHRIGIIRKGRPGSVFLNGRRLPALGYDHFRNP